MKKFQFSLEALLSYREHVEMLARQEVAKVQAEINRANEYIRELTDLLEAAESELEEKAAQGMSVAEMNFYTAFISSLKAKIAVEAGLLEQLKLLIRQKQRELAEKSVEKKVIENLKEKRKQEYYDDMDKLMQKESDDTVLISKKFKPDDNN